MTATVPEGHAGFGTVAAHAYSTAVRVQVGSLRRPAAPSGADVSAYYDVDAAGSVRAITDDAGVTTARYDYLPFGERFNAPAPDARSSAIQPRQYTGREYDQRTWAKNNGYSTSLLEQSTRTDDVRGTRFSYSPQRREELSKMRAFVWLSWLIGAICAVVSGYGWWFHFAVGPAHGPGRELGLVAGLLSLAAFGCGWRLNKARTGS